MSKPLAVDLFCGKGGWAHGLLAAGWQVRGYDIEDHGGYPAELVLRDVLTLTGEDVADAELFVASPPCQAYSYMAMPWTRARAMAERHRRCWALRCELTELFRFCFRLQRMAINVRGGRHLPLIVENVCGAQPWVGRAAWHFGSFYLWGDVPALMPRATAGIKQGGNWWHDPDSMTRRHSSRSKARKEASARIAMIPFALARHIGDVYHPLSTEATARGERTMRRSKEPLLEVR